MLKASELKTGSVVEINGVAHVVKNVDVKILKLGKNWMSR
jgi:translation elongation factor P/translation initiation factor 5A